MLRGIRVGELDTRITIESSTSVKNAITNEPELTWSALKTVWAKELQPQSREDYEASQQVALDTVRWMIRRDTEVTEVMRCVRGGNTFYISGIQDKGREGYMILTAEKRDNV